MGTLGQKGKVRGLSDYSIQLGRTSQKKGGMCSGLNDVRNDVNNACCASCFSSNILHTASVFPLATL